jgi:MerR family transcriptional regulator/heat shock protein HspR
MNSKETEPRYVISIAAKMLSTQTHTLRYYEKTGIIEPFRTKGNIRLYSERDIARIRQMKTLTEDLGVNLAGVEIILRMSQQIAELQRTLEYVKSELRRFREEQT